MKTVLWAALTANGNYAKNSADHPPKKETLEDFAAQVKKSGNFIVGRRTFEGFNTNGGGNPFGDIDIVVVSRGNLEMPGTKLVSSPQEALNYLRQKGHEVALLAGGESLHNAFLAENLVDELIFDVIPILESEGFNLLLPIGKFRNVRLLNFENIGGGVIQLHYLINHVNS